MAELEIDFEGTGNNTDGGQTGATTQTSTVDNNGTKDDVTNMSGDGTDDVTGKDNNNNNATQTPDNNGEGNNDEENNDDTNNSSTGELEVGTQVEF